TSLRHLAIAYEFSDVNRGPDHHQRTKYMHNSSDLLRHLPASLETFSYIGPPFDDCRELAKLQHLSTLVYRSDDVYENQTDRHRTPAKWAPLRALTHLTTRNWYREAAELFPKLETFVYT